jgi:hypothetical protein
LGGARRPPTREAVLAKFRGNAALIGKAADVEALEATVLSIEHRPVSTLSQALRQLKSIAVAHAAE